MFFFFFGGFVNPEVTNLDCNLLMGLINLKGIRYRKWVFQVQEETTLC